MSRYPEELVNWSGDKAGGVKKLFYKGSGRPSGDVITTGLLSRLKAWAADVAREGSNTPKVVLLVGGPGNGKTEAIEYTIRELDAAMNLDGRLVTELESRFAVTGGSLSRLVRTTETKFPPASGVGSIAIVQDGSEAERGSKATPAELLYEDLRQQLTADAGSIYVACINRGVLDDALILAAERSEPQIGNLFRQVVQSVSLRASGGPCWPLDGYPNFAVWPMDVESLVDEPSEGAKNSAARQIVSTATAEEHWPQYGTCAAGELCPFCTNRRLMAGQPNADSFIQILRWFELSSGKRWNFRDLFSLMAHLLAGTASPGGGESYDPCQWAHAQLNPKEPDPVKREIKRVRGLLRLLATQYQHALFGEWPVERASALRADLKDLKLENHPALAALYQFLALDQRKGTTSTLRSQLSGMVAHLDPAVANPELRVTVTGNWQIQFKDLDRLFSLSIQGGRAELHKHRCLSFLENELLKALGEADETLSEEAVRRRKPTAADRAQGLIRLIACKIARRSVGVRCGVTKDADVLLAFGQVLKGDASALDEATRGVESLLIKDRRFYVSLNTTFGEPLPPPERRAMLSTTSQKVRQMRVTDDGRRPMAPVRFLSVGSAVSARPVALTYELFKATKSLEKGMVPASLPRSVVALLDTTRAKLAGMVVRDEDSLEDCEIRLGLRDDIITTNFNGFVVRREVGK